MDTPKAGNAKDGQTSGEEKRREKNAGYTSEYAYYEKKPGYFFTKVILRIDHYGVKYPYAEKANQA